MTTTTTIKYVGPHDAVELNRAGLEGDDWVKVGQGETVDLPGDVAKGLLEQPDNWVKPGESKRRTSKPRVAKGGAAKKAPAKKAPAKKSTAPAGDPTTPPAGDTEV